jgi:alpha-tubulin suppressor-like RCC1 family protein
MALAVDGRVWTWGRGKYGALGHGDTASQREPVLVAGLAPVVVIAAGGSHSVVLSQRGRVYSWGRNSQGQLGLGNFTDASSPVVVDGSESWNVAQVRSGPLYQVASVCMSDMCACL